METNFFTTLGIVTGATFAVIGLIVIIGIIVSWLDGNFNFYNIISTDYEFRFDGQLWSLK